MCHYITVTLPHAAELDSVTGIFKSHKLGFELISNPRVAEQIDRQDWQILTCRNHCDCGTALGSLSRTRSTEVVTYERDLDRFRKHGWSEAKIKRWLEQKEQAKERHRREEDEALAKGGAPEIERWIELLKEVLKSQPVLKVGILLHWYHGRVDSEDIKIQRRETVRMPDVNAERLMKIEEDVLYEIIR